jgi:hypothetical protein
MNQVGNHPAKREEFYREGGKDPGSLNTQSEIE